MNIGKTVIIAILSALLLIQVIFNLQLQKQGASLNTKIKKYSYEQVGDTEIYQFTKGKYNCFLASSKKGVSINCQPTK